MFQISENIDLKALNTFGITVNGRYYCEVHSEKDILELISTPTFKNNEKLILGGGSNILFTKDFDGLVIQNKIKGISIVMEDNEHVFVKAGAGEVWHDFVMWCVNKNYGGLENLSLIPGCVGASPMQNIGAYGVEIKDVFHELEAVNLANGAKKIFNKSECEFGYRESCFKHKYKNTFIITSVTFCLNKKPAFNTSYGAINDELKSMNAEVNIKNISQAVINIRSSKLPDPKQIGNAGSFFKNPEVNKAIHAKLKNEFPQLVSYPLDNGNYKLAAGWLIEHSGLKGFVSGSAGVHDKQALVLVNKGGANGKEIYALSEHVLQTVFNKFGVTLEREVNII